MTEASMARMINFGARVGGFFKVIEKRILPTPESFTFEKESGVWKHVTSEGKVAAGERDVKNMARLQDLTDQIRELSKSSKP